MEFPEEQNFLDELKQELIDLRAANTHRMVDSNINEFDDHIYDYFKYTFNYVGIDPKDVEEILLAALLFFRHFKAFIEGTVDVDIDNDDELQLEAMTVNAFVSCMTRLVQEPDDPRYRNTVISSD